MRTSTRRFAALLPLLLAFVLAWALPARAEFNPDPRKLPRPQGYVTDFAGMLQDETRQQLEGLLTELEQKTTAEVAVVTVPSLGDQEVQPYSVALYESWKMGKKGKDNGVLFLIAPNERKLWITTGYGLEGDLPDVTLHGIYEVVRDQFRAGQMDRGVVLGTVAIAQKIAAADSVQLTGELANTRVEAPHRTRRRTGPGELLFIFFIIFILIVLSNRFGGGRRGGFTGGGPGPFFFGGMGGGGGGGGFGGGGFGGFGGGGTGGGGAGGGW